MLMARMVIPDLIEALGASSFDAYMAGYLPTHSLHLHGLCPLDVRSLDVGLWTISRIYRYLSLDTLGFGLVR